MEWRDFVEVFDANCQSAAGDQVGALLPNLCACALDKLKSNHPLDDVLQGRVPGDTIQNYSAECMMSMTTKGIPFPVNERAELVEQCVSGAAAMGDKADGYCECSISVLESDYSYSEVMQGYVTPSTYERIARECLG